MGVAQVPPTWIFSWEGQGSYHLIPLSCGDAADYQFQAPSLEEQKKDYYNLKLGLVST